MELARLLKDNDTTSRKKIYYSFMIIIIITFEFSKSQSCDLLTSKDLLIGCSIVKRGLLREKL